MSVEEGHNICRLCLKMTKNDCAEIDEIMKQVFDILSLKMDLNIIKDPIICQGCVEVAKKCLNFKSTCIDTEEIILSYSNGRKKTKQNIKVIYKEREHMGRVFDEDLHICRFCMARLERDNFVYLDTLMNDNMFEMLSYMTEMDLNTIEDPIICDPCREILQCYFNFASNCFDIEEKIKLYCREERADSMGQVEFGNIIHFLLQDILECPIKNPQEYVTKEESNTFKMNQTEDEYLKTYDELIKLEEVDIKEEEINLKENSYESLSEIKLDKDEDMPLHTEIGTEAKLDIVSLNVREYNTKEYTYQKKVQANIVENSPILGNIPGVKENYSETQIKEYATSYTKERENDKSDFIINIDTSDAGTFKYTSCISESKKHNILKNHKSICEGATEMKQKNNINGCVSLQKYSLDPQGYSSVYKDAPEEIMYKCDLCTYEAKRKYRLKMHMLVHKDTSKIKMYKCSLCAYDAKHNNSLKTHMLVHRNPLELRMYKCSLCNFETKRKRTLGPHMLVHKDPSEIKMYKCDLCTYETKRKCDFITHMLVHKDPSEIEMYKCDLCTYETKRKRDLRPHMLVHKDPSEIKMYKCSLCAYEAKLNSRLKRHMFVHRDPSELKMYKCSLCTYETKRKRDLRPHMLVHKDIQK